LTNDYPTALPATVLLDLRPEENDIKNWKLDNTKSQNIYLVSIVVLFEVEIAVGSINAIAVVKSLVIEPDQY
jgi:hypothetical protein